MVPANAPNKSTADENGRGPFDRARFHGHERPLGGEHHAEDDQHQRAADINDQLRRADEVRAKQEVERGNSSQSEQSQPPLGRCSA